MPALEACRCVTEHAADEHFASVLWGVLRSGEPCRILCDDGDDPRVTETIAVVIPVTLWRALLRVQESIDAETLWPPT